MDLAEWAQWYAAQGVPVFPLHGAVDGTCTCGEECASPAKHPRTKFGLNDATCEPGAITDWWRRWPAANIGLRTGVMFDALDIDGEAGRFAFRAWRDGRDLPNAPTSLTQSGGWHILFAPTGAGNRAKMVDHVDWRGRGGYIVAPPSTGVRGPYRWRGMPALDTIPVAPTWLRDLVLPPRPPERPIAPNVVDRTSRYGEVALRNILTRLAEAGNGSRNNALNEAAYACGRLIGSGVMDEGVAARALLHMGTALGLGDKETRLTVHSGLLAGIRNPRQVGE